MSSLLRGQGPEGPVADHVQTEIPGFRALTRQILPVEDFEAAALDRHHVRAALVPPRYRSGYFAHVFAGGYDAGYYSYLWSEVLDADMVGWFEENGGLRRENGDRFRDLLLSRGGSVDPMAAFASVRGRAPSTEPLLRRRGLVG